MELLVDGMQKVTMQPMLDTLRYLNDNQYGTDVLLGGMLNLSAKLGITLQDFSKFP